MAAKQYVMVVTVESDDDDDIETVASEMDGRLLDWEDGRTGCSRIRVRPLSEVIAS